MKKVKRGPQDTRRSGKISERKREELLFELGFYEEIVAKRPAYIDAKKWLANLYTELGFYQDGLRQDQDICRAEPGDSLARYNLACSYALVGDRDAALAELREARRLGYDDNDHMAKDPDLAALRDDPRFREFIRQ